MELSDVQQEVEGIHNSRDDPVIACVKTTQLWFKVLSFAYGHVDGQAKSIISAALKAAEVKFPKW